MLTITLSAHKKRHPQTFYRQGISLALFLFFTTLLPSLSFITSENQTYFIAKAHAEEVNFKMYPSTLQIRAKSPSDVAAPFIFENLGTQPVKMKIRYRVINTANSADGQVTFLGVGNLGTTPKVFDYIQVMDSDNAPLDSLDIGPKQKKQLQLRIQVPPNQPAIDSYFSIIFLHDITPSKDQIKSNQDKKDQHTISALQAAVATNVFLSIGDQETPLGSIEEFSAPWYNHRRSIPFTLKIKNRGLHYINPTGVIFIKNVFGQTVGRVDIPSRTLLAGTTRTFSDQIISKQNIIWQDDLPLGFYTANLQMAMSESGPVYHQTIRFSVFPISAIALFLLFFGAFATLTLKLRKKRRMHHK